MGHLTQRFDVEFEAATYTAGVDLDTVDGWGKIAGGGTQDIFSITDATLGGDQCAAARNNTTGASAAYEKAIGVTRSTEDWVLTFKCRIAATAEDGQYISVGLAAGAYNPVSEANMACDVRFHRNAAGENVALTSLVEEGPSVANGVATLAQTFAVRVRITSGHGVSIEIDDDNDNEGWVPFRSGTLKDGEEAIDRVFISIEAGGSADDLLLVDDIRIVEVDKHDRVDFLERPPRLARVKSGSASQVGSMVEFTVTIYDESTGEELTERPGTMPASYLETGDEGRTLIDGVLEAILKEYDKGERVTDFSTSGHEVTH